MHRKCVLVGRSRFTPLALLVYKHPILIIGKSHDVMRYDNVCIL